MENSEILALTFKLKEELINSELYKELKDKEKKMMEDEETSKLLLLYQGAQSNYNEAKRFEKYGSDMDKASKELSDIKQRVYENKFVKEYNEMYKKMNKELKRILDIK